MFEQLCNDSFPFFLTCFRLPSTWFRSCDGPRTLFTLLSRVLFAMALRWLLLLVLLLFGFSSFHDGSKLTHFLRLSRSNWTTDTLVHSFSNTTFCFASDFHAFSSTSTLETRGRRGLFSVQLSSLEYQQWNGKYQISLRRFLLTPSRTVTPQDRRRLWSNLRKLRFGQCLLRMKRPASSQRRSWGQT